MSAQDVENKEGTPATGAASADAAETPAAAPAGGGSASSGADAEAAAPTPEATETPAADEALPPLAPGGTTTRGENLDLVMDVTVDLTVELGGAELPLREILGLGPGAVVRLNRKAGDPVDIRINHELIARGEVVVVDERFGVRITELVKGGEDKPRDPA